MISLRPFHPHLLVVAIVAATSLLFAAGCSRGGPKTLPVVGQVKISGVDSSVLAGHTLEIALDTNRQVRAAGEIQSDGSFELADDPAGCRAYRRVARCLSGAARPFRRRHCPQEPRRQIHPSPPLAV